MKNPYSLEHPFDPEKFASLLRKAIGTQTQTAFSKQCGISNSYLSKYINKQLDRPPVPNTILKIASIANNDVTAMELLDAAGYKFDNIDDIQAPTADSPTDKPIPVLQSIAERPSYYYRRLKLETAAKLRGIILSELETLPCQKISTEDVFTAGTLLITRTIRMAPIDLWQFHFIQPAKASGSLTPSSPFIFFHNHIATAIGQAILDIGRHNSLVTSRQRDKEEMTLYQQYYHPKLSFVVTDEDSFNAILTYKNLPFIHLLVSVILADLKSFTILKEEYLNTDIPFAEYEHDPSITFGLK